MYAEKQSPEVRELATAIYRRHRPHLLSIAYANAADGADAEEALQDAFIIFIDHFDPDTEAPPLAWLTLTLKRRCWAMSSHRRLHRHAVGEPERDFEEPRFALESAPAALPPTERRVAERDDARRRLHRLKPDQRTAIGLHAAGFSYREIAQRKGWTYTKVNRCVSEGRVALRMAAEHL